MIPTAIIGQNPQNFFRIIDPIISNLAMIMHFHTRQAKAGVTDWARCAFWWHTASETWIQGRLARKAGRSPVGQPKLEILLSTAEQIGFHDKYHEI
jgi:hypothetical protein